MHGRRAPCRPPVAMYTAPGVPCTRDVRHGTCCRATASAVRLCTSTAMRRWIMIAVGFCSACAPRPPAATHARAHTHTHARTHTHTRTAPRPLRARCKAPPPRAYGKPECPRASQHDQKRYACYSTRSKRAIPPSPLPLPSRGAHARVRAERTCLPASAATAHAKRRASPSALPAYGQRTISALCAGAQHRRGKSVGAKQQRALAGAGTMPPVPPTSCPCTPSTYAPAGGQPSRRGAAR